MIKTLVFLFAFSTLIQSQNFWQPSNGPYTLGGYIQCETIDLDGYLYVGTIDSGIYYSTDLGNDWSNSSLNGYTINSISSSPNGYIYATVGQVIYRSADHGMNWTQINNGLPSISLGQVSCSSQDIVYLATSEGLYSSLDYGTNWERIDSGFSSSVIKGVLNCSNGDVYAYLNWSIYRCTDNGLSWISLSGLPPYKVTHLTSDELNNLFLTLSEGTSSVFLGYRSTDQGLTWEQFGASCPLFFHFVEVAPDGSLYIQGQFGIYRSTDLGESWSQISSLTDSRCFSFFSNEIVFAGSLTGIRKSTNAGVDWSVVGLPIDNPRILSLATNSTGIVFAGGKGNFPVISKTTNQGQEWFNINATFDGTIISALELDEDDNLLAGSYGGGIYFSNDFGTTWVQRNNGLTDLHITALKLILNGEAFVGTDNAGIFHTSDYGMQWNPINDGLTVTRIEDIAIALSGNIYIGTTDGVFGSTNHGMNWTHLNNGWAQYRQVISIAVNSQEHIFAENAGYGIYRSTDLGNSWILVSTDIYSPIYDIFINSQDTIFAAGANGVFRSTNNGEDWTLFNSGIQEFDEVIVLISDIDGKLVAGTEITGVQWTTYPTTSVEQIKKTINTFYLYQNYPNPFNPLTTILYSIKE